VHLALRDGFVPGQSLQSNIESEDSQYLLGVRRM
jgi:hypothetical protein